MWDTFCQIIDEGVSRDPGVDEDFMHTDLWVICSWPLTTLMKDFSENQQYKKFLLLIEVLPAIIKVLQRAGEQAGPELSLELDRVVSHGSVIFIR